MTAIVDTRRLSFEEYCQLDDSDRRYELVNGELRLMNPPTGRHFLIAGFLQETFKDEIKRLQHPWTCLQGAGVRTGLAKSRLPDLIVVPTEAVMELLDRSAVFQTAPFLAVEIVSPSSSVDDYRYKRSEYGAIEIPEYWIVDARDRKVTVLCLEEGFYEETIYTDNDAISSKLFPELDVTVDRIFQIGEK
ncbi:Uma2 family endonuclease [Baaleninema simplex]|uniref:Uma2 family endonuclease n=1 Tax=Baaleninema simplex TaxID=2862350 RepID=UPI000476AE01|nr:Uma2 family endonuclease [Baaleninema simplex]